MTRRDDLGDRMKSFEAAFDHVLPPGNPVIARLDGRSFHSIASLFDQPFDGRFKDAMDAGAMAVTREFDGKMAFVQSDEATILFMPATSDGATRVFNHRIQKVCSVFASLFATTFHASVRDAGVVVPPVSFDCRCFIVPRDEVVNAFIWRQKDAIKNAASSIFYHALRRGGMTGREASKHMAGKTAGEMAVAAGELLGKDIESIYPARCLRGACITTMTRTMLVEDLMDPAIHAVQLERGNVVPGQTVTRRSWVVDRDIPLFWERRDYIEDAMRE